MSHIQLTPDQIEELTKLEVERALLTLNRKYKNQFRKIGYHLDTAREMLREFYSVMFSNHPDAPKQKHRRPYNVAELQALLSQGKKGKEIA